MKMRIMQTNELRGLLYESGFVLSEGHRALLKELPAVLLEAQSRLPAMLLESLQEQIRGISDLEADIGKSNDDSQHSFARHRRARRLPRSPGSGC